MIKDQVVNLVQSNSTADNITPLKAIKEIEHFNLFLLMILSSPRVS